MMSQVMQHTNASGAEAMKASSASSSAGMMIFAGQSCGMANRARADAGPARTGAGLGQFRSCDPERCCGNCQSVSESMVYFVWYNNARAAKEGKNVM